SLEVVPESLALDVGDAVTVAANFRDARGNLVPGAVAVWSSSDGTILAVEQLSTSLARVTALAPGSAQAVVQTADGPSGAILVTVAGGQGRLASVRIEPEGGVASELGQRLEF